MKSEPSRKERKKERRERERDEGGNRRFIEDEKVNKLGRALESVREDFRVGKHGAEWSVYVSPSPSIHVPLPFTIALSSPHPLQFFSAVPLTLRACIQSLATHHLDSLFAFVFVALYSRTNNYIGII